MKKNVTIIDCEYSSSLFEIPFNEPDGMLSPGDKVIFKDSESKEEYGAIKQVNVPLTEKDRFVESGKILRKATANDTQKVESHKEHAEAALLKCREIVDRSGLFMNVFRAAYSFDGTKLHFTFTSDDRVDFRDLVKDLAKSFQKQIHLRQIGPRDKARLIGGYGKCGRKLCCSVWLGKIQSINMEMVRVQTLESKGSSKLSGACGKLLCCLKYEVEDYRDLKKNLPEIGNRVRLKKKGDGIIIALDVLNQKVRVLFEGGESLVVNISEIEKVLKPNDKLVSEGTDN